MRFYYGDKNIHRALDEMEFWKRQEAEHTVVIQEIVGNLEERFVKQLDSFQKEFAKVEGKTVQYIEAIIRSKGNISPMFYQQTMQLINLGLEQSQKFVLLLNEMLEDSKAVSDNPVAVTVINHIRRESEYFIGIAKTILYNY